MLDHNLVLKDGELYLAGNITTDGSTERATGLYMRDTRHLSEFLMRINGVKPEPLSTTTHDATHATVISANPVMTLTNGEVVPPHSVMFRQTVALEDRLISTFELQNFGRRRLSLELQFEITADFRDLFDIRGFSRTTGGKWLKPRLGTREMTLGYRGLDGKIVETVVAFDKDATDVLHRRKTITSEGFLVIVAGTEELFLDFETFKLHRVYVTFDVELDHLETWKLTTNVVPVPVAVPHVEAPAPIAGATARIRSGNPALDSVLARCHADLEMLQTTFPHGSLPAAGIPWFVAPFGRDSLITGLQTLFLRPAQAAGTLRVLAALQGTEIEPGRDEQPGKILHEMRYGEMARLGEVPHSPYYGSVDSTPLWVWLFAETIAWTGDADLYRELKPNAVRALDWIEKYGDLDGDGLVEYRTEPVGGGRILNQVWKDSFDSVNHRDGTIPQGPIAAVEVQGYIYAACVRLADVATSCGDEDWARTLRAWAERVRRTVEDCFWMAADDTYAQALDGHKQQIQAVSSNPGHLLLCGLPSPERASRMARRFLQPDLDSGWGIRTLSSDAATYNPMSYHNGSIWPHDNGLIAAGFYRYGEHAAGERIATELFDLARTNDLHRLRELYCGFPREGVPDEDPVDYPVSCVPQAWAAGALPMVVQAMLGLAVNTPGRTITINPALPAWIDKLEINGLSILGQTGSLMASGHGEDRLIETDGLPTA